MLELVLYLTILGVASCCMVALRFFPPRSLRRLYFARFSMFDVVQGFIAVAVTVCYLGMLFFSLWNAYIPAYANLFQSLLDWSAVPASIWSLYFGYQLRGIVEG